MSGIVCAFLSARFLVFAFVLRSCSRLFARSFLRSCPGLFARSCPRVFSCSRSFLRSCPGLFARSCFFLFAFVYAFVFRVVCAFLFAFIFAFVSGIVCASCPRVFSCSRSFLRSCPGCLRVLHVPLPPVCQQSKAELDRFESQLQKLSGEQSRLQREHGKLEQQAQVLETTLIGRFFDHVLDPLASDWSLINDIP